MIATVLLIIVSLGAFAYSVASFDIWSSGMPGSGLMPIVGAGLAILSCAAVLITERTTLIRPTVSRAPLAYAVAFALLLPLSWAVGLLPALGVLCVAILRYVERLSLGRSLAFALLVAGGSWLLFERLLLVPLPHGSLWSF
jgi:putative tricarboxylic transport membrane protein